MGQSRNFTKRLTLGVILALALGALSLSNWAERGRFGVPEDGVLWADSEAGVVASRVESEGPAARVGVRPGDRLVSIGGQPVYEALDATRILADAGAWSRAEYLIERDGQASRVSLVIRESTSRGAVGSFLMALGWAYALIGILVWLRCRRDSATIRFYGFCLASLAVFSLSSTGELDGFDRLVYWVDVWALLLLPPLFLDFCDRFPNGVARHPGRARISYALAIAVGAAHHAAAGNWVSGGVGDPQLAEFFDAAPLLLFSANLILAAIVVWGRSQRSSNPLHRTQMRVLLLGAATSVVPFTAFYAVPFVLGSGPGPSQAFSVLSLGALPASIAVALFRYRLLEFEVVWRRATASAVTTGLMLFGGYVAYHVMGPSAPWLDRYGPLLWLFSLAVSTALFRPVRDLILRLFERKVFRERYEERRTLADFAGELAADPDRGRIVKAVSSRLAKALEVDRVIVLARQEGQGKRESIFRVLRGGAFADERLPRQLDMAALTDHVPEFGTATVITGSLAGTLPASLANLGCRHFVPCRLRDQTLAWIALGSPRGGGFLTSDDLSLVEAVAAPFAIALENARLYSSLQAKATQYQRLKDYNENIVESLSVGILALDLQDRVQSWNAQLELGFHISRDEAVGRRLGELLPDSLVRGIAGCQDGNGNGQIYKIPLRAADFPKEFRPAESAATAERRFNVAVAPLIAKDFRRVGRLVILDDVTERVELEERVVQAEKLSSVGLLAAGVAHEVNTPLAVISSYSQSLAAKFSKESAEGRILGKVTEQTFRASEIVNSLLDFSRTAGTEMARCDLDRAIEDVLDLIAPQLRHANVSVTIDLCAEAPVLANRGKLQQVFLNLFLNARDAMPGGGSLTISSRLVPSQGDAGHVEVLVSDSGIGIDPADQGRIFDPFFTTKEPGRGSGLGLAVTYGIVQEHSGSISVQSSRGEGTAFSLAFPVARQSVHA